jgi:hypothetical protein
MKRINKLGKILLRRKRISKEDLDALLKEQKLLGWKLGQIAVESGLVQKKDVEEALREQIEEEIFDMFMWKEAAFEFVEGRAPKVEESNPLSGLTFDANVMSLILEAARRADELLMIRRILTDDDMTLTKFPFEIQAEELGPDMDRRRDPADHQRPPLGEGGRPRIELPALCHDARHLPTSRAWIHQGPGPQGQHGQGCPFGPTRSLTAWDRSKAMSKSWGFPISCRRCPWPAARASSPSSSRGRRRSSTSRTTASAS